MQYFSFKAKNNSKLKDFSCQDSDLICVIIFVLIYTDLCEMLFH